MPRTIRFKDDQIQSRYRVPERGGRRFASKGFGRFRETVLVSRRECPAAPESQQIVDLALSPAVILDGEGIYAGIYANVANKEIRSLDKMGDLIFTPFAEA